MIGKSKPVMAPAAALLLVVLCAACDGGGSAGSDAGLDGGDTDTLRYDGGPLVDCDGVIPPSPGGGQVCIPGGTYLMGCMPYDTWCEDSEKPMVEVTLSPFWIDRREATYADVVTWLNGLDDSYQKIDGGVLDPTGEEVLWIQGGEDGPPICYDADADIFTWGDADCAGCGGPKEAAAGGFYWLGAKLFCEHQGKRLPTEAEWEAAARGQTKLIWPCEWQYAPCSHGAYSMCNSYDECFTDTCCSPWLDEWYGNCESPFGVRAMYGNAWEWVLDGADGDHSWCLDGCVDPAPRPPIDQGEFYPKEYVAKGSGTAGSYGTWTRISARPALAFGNVSTGVRCVTSPVLFGEDDTADDTDSGSDGGGS